MRDENAPPGRRSTVAAVGCQSSDAAFHGVIASGGVGNLDHLVDGVTQGGADAVLAASAEDMRFFAAGARPDRWRFDLSGYCAARLRALGLRAVEDTATDTLADEARFFSHRRRTLAGGGPLGHQLSAIALLP